MELKNLLNDLLKCKCEIHIKIDTETKNAKDNFQLIKGSIPCILTGLSMLIKALIEDGIPKDLITDIIELELENKGTNNGSKRSITTKNETNAKVTTEGIELKGEEAKAFMEFLKDLGG